jgi:hypothetical protein
MTAATTAVNLQRCWEWQLSDLKTVTFSHFEKERSTIPCIPPLITAEHLLTVDVSVVNTA